MTVHGPTTRLAIAALSLFLAHPRAIPQSREAASQTRGPVFVPLDSWIYPVLTRLAALGYIPDQAAGLRPWTRQECIRQLGEAETGWVADRGPSQREAARLITALRREFEGESQFSSGPYVELDSLYLRTLAISGQPLVDGYNFGQTIVNDFNRPSGEGANVAAGFTAEGGAGRFSFYTRSEFQRSAPFASPAAALAPGDNQVVPVLIGAPGGITRFQPLEMYAGVQLGKWALTVGQQDLWWGPGEAGPLSFSDNAAPILMFRLTSASPLALPGLLRRLGVFRVDVAGGELSGHHLPRRPLMNAQKLTWNVTADLELGFTRWSLFDGSGVHGFTAGSVFRNLFANGATFGHAADPGDRKSGFDFRWRPPLPGRFLTLYADLYADDEPTPLASPRRSAFSPGIYVPRLPGLSHWDLRVEAPSTRGADKDRGGQFFYWNNVYQDANTNDGGLLGDWVGRDGRGLFVQAAYWRSPRSHFEFTWRQNRIGAAFLPGGGTQDDAGVRGILRAGPGWSISAFAQYERYSIPLLGGRKSDLAASVEIFYTPKWRLSRN
ncbi:MAG: capsule assembly Wzi family protein [Acidobacteriia bacterium]|nr:capsule assembly Wzi family protein [Terriglobia bacterium]